MRARPDRVSAQAVLVRINELAAATNWMSEQVGAETYGFRLTLEEVEDLLDVFEYYAPAWRRSDDERAFLSPDGSALVGIVRQRRAHAQRQAAAEAQLSAAEAEARRRAVAPASFVGVSFPIDF